MTEKIDYKQVPIWFAHCFRTDCKQADNCLRHRVTSFIPEDKKAVFALVSNRMITDGECPEFVPAQRVTYAWGMSHLWDNLPHQVVLDMQKTMRAHFGRTRYYRLKREEIDFTPEDLEYVNDLFRQYNIAEKPAFDSYDERYQWK